MPWLRGNHGENGQAMVMAAAAMIVLLGFAAFAVDIGHVAVVKSDLQNAADAAALAGVVEMPSEADANRIALQNAKDNGMLVVSNDVELNGEKVKITSPGNKQLRVECSRTVDYYFAGVLGFESQKVTAVAVAEKNSSSWSGESLPFVNLGFDYSKTDPTAWTQVGPGIKGTIYDFRTITGPKDDDWYFEVDWADGITVKPGYSNGLKSSVDGSTLKTGLDKILVEPDDVNVKVVYIYSLRADIIASITKTSNPGKFWVVRGGKDTQILLKNLKNNDIIKPDQLVLIQCLFLDFKDSNQHEIELKYLGKTYDLGNSGNDIKGKPLADLPDTPTEYINSSNSIGAKLIQ